MSEQTQPGFKLNINFQGGKNENLDFKMGPNTSADHSCSANLNGEMFVFGGDGVHTKQVQYLGVSY